MGEQLYRDVNLLDERVKRGLNQGESIAKIIKRSCRSSAHILPIVGRYLNMSERERKDKCGLSMSDLQLQNLKSEYAEYMARESRVLRPAR